MKLETSSFNAARILVVGDVMLDRYWHGAASRISPEAPVPVVHVTEMQERPGGAGNVALNLSVLGCQVDLLSIVGDDHFADVLEKKLSDAKICCHFHRLPGLPTVTKLRVIGRNQQLIRLDFEESLAISKTENLLPDFKLQLAGVDALLLSDYAKGTLHHAQAFIVAAKEQGIPVLVDPKNRDFNLYRGATIITPNQKEFEAVVGTCATESEIIAKGQGLLRDYDISALLITRGEQGMTLLQEGKKPLHLPTHVREVYDVTGAGDTVIAVLTAMLATGESLENGATLANIAAGLVIQKLGAASVSVPELRRALQKHQGMERGVLTEEQLILAINDARAHGETVVMTNGCFDILHPGHVQYLEEAKKLGTRLIVAVNDDDSVKKLKGNSRPLQSLTDRMTVLAGLRSVDWVVPFSEETPQRLIERVTPDILVKGADYTVSQIAGAEHVLANNGRVELLNFRPGCSSSAIIAKAQGKALA